MKRYKKNGVDQCWSCSNCVGSQEYNGWLLPVCKQADKAMLEVYDRPCRALNGANPEETDIVNAIGHLVLEKYHRAKELNSKGLHIKNPLAWAIYQTYREYDREGIGIESNRTNA